MRAFLPPGIHSRQIAAADVIRELEHPEAEKINRALELMGLATRVRAESAVRITTWFDSPKGAVALSSRRTVEGREP